ncbi:MAG TPA: carboxypeptidase-like regulatory domain-containing protein [Candidatus Polarisedimenticolia bacterium]|nr:carboxypeptidase-like regulatory domain-containing protein [Candidatus Polarisedimenticolia bacterium]
MTRKAGSLDRMVAGALVLALVAYCIPGPAFAAAAPAAGASAAAVPAEIRGNVLSSDGLTVIPGVSVKAAHLETSTVYSSTKTGPDGVYSLGSLPAGTYDLAVETPEGLFAADTVVAVQAGHRTLVSLALRPGAVRQDTPPEQPPAEGEEQKPEEEKPEETPAQPEPDQKPAKKKGGFWRSPTGAAIAIVVGAGLVGAAANSAASDDDDDDEPLTQSGNE